MIYFKIQVTLHLVIYYNKTINGFIQMAKNCTLINKKNNPLAAVVHQRGISPSLTSRSNCHKPEPGFSKVTEYSKLYTFCSSQNKNDQEEHNQNKSTINTTRERKVSVHHIKGKLHEPSKKQKVKNNNSCILSKYKKNDNNFSVAELSSLSSAFEKKSHRHEDKKLNMSINIDAKTIKSFQNQQKRFTKLLTVAPKTQMRSTEKKACELVNLAKQQEGGVKQKIILDEKELKIFTKKFAQELFANQQKIKILQEKIQEWQMRQEEWKKMSLEWDQSQKLYQNERSETSYIKKRVIELANQNYYLNLIIKKQRQTIQDLNSHISELKTEILKLKEVAITSRPKSQTGASIQIQNKELKDRINLLNIQNTFFRKQLCIHNSFENQFSSSSQLSSQRLSAIFQENRKLHQQLKQHHLEKITLNAYKKTVQQLTYKLSLLQQNNQSLRSKFTMNCQQVEIQPSHQQKYEFHNKHYQRSATSPSEVECVWKRQKDESSMNTSEFKIEMPIMNYLKACSQC